MLDPVEQPFLAEALPSYAAPVPDNPQAAITLSAKGGFDHHGARSGQLSRLPPQSFFLVSGVFHYLGPSLAVLLFARLDVLGVAWLRVATAAAVFAVWRRPWRLARRPGGRRAGIADPRNACWPWASCSPS